MNDFWENLVLLVLIALVVAVVILLGYIIIYSFNLTGTAIGHYTAIYCDPNGCDDDQASHSDYLYPDDSLTCPNQASIFQYFLFIGKILVPQYQTYYLLEGSCQVTILDQ